MSSIWKLDTGDEEKELAFSTDAQSLTKQSRGSQPPPRAKHDIIKFYQHILILIIGRHCVICQLLYERFGCLLRI